MKVNKGGNPWYVYIVRYIDGTLYTGITKDLNKRIGEHNSDKGGAKYTKSRRPVDLVYSEQVESRSAAAKLEYRFIRMPCAKKKEMIAK